MAQNLNLITIEETPYNAATPLAALTEPVTPSELFYVRNHFQVPDLGLEEWRLKIEGLVQAPTEFSLADLQALGSRTCRMLMECAGNAREELSPPAPGTQWDHGAVSQADFTGVPLHQLLGSVGVLDSEVEILFEGADGGMVESDRRVNYARSLPLDKALHPDTLLAWAMNGKPLPKNHGYPLRLIVPNWYGMASVKWLTRIEAVSEPFAGYFQRERYIYLSEQTSKRIQPVTEIKVRSLITHPSDGSALHHANALIQGLAWSGQAPVERVELSWDDGQHWQKAKFTPSPARYAAGSWQFHLPELEPGEYTLAVRAHDQAGNSQPLEPQWNSLGYGNNGVQSIKVALLGV
ncbi:MAG: sulfite oxidase [Anaerolineales bacterium]